MQQRNHLYYQFNRKDSPLFNKDNEIYATGGARKPSTLAA